MKSIRLVTHCYAATLPQYARFLAYQIASIHVYRPQCQITLDVCYDPEDALTSGVLDFYVGELGCSFVHRRPLPLPLLGKRCIGRNAACLEAVEDVVFLTDVDHLFFASSLDNVLQIMGEQPATVGMIYPSSISIMRSHDLGDIFASLDCKENPLHLPLPEEFVPKHYSRAIGGVQIIRGSFAREYGYLYHDSHWLKPLRFQQKPFGTFRDDMAFRWYCVSQGFRIVQVGPMPEIKRMRHTETSYH